MDSERRRNPETKVLDFVERWIKFALSQINLLSVIWVDSKRLFRKLVHHWRHM